MPPRFLEEVGRGATPVSVNLGSLPPCGGWARWSAGSARGLPLRLPLRYVGRVGGEGGGPGACNVRLPSPSRRSPSHRSPSRRSPSRASPRNRLPGHRRPDHRRPDDLWVAPGSRRWHGDCRRLRMYRAVCPGQRTRGAGVRSGRAVRRPLGCRLRGRRGHRGGRRRVRGGQFRRLGRRETFGDRRPRWRAAHLVFVSHRGHGCGRIGRGGRVGGGSLRVRPGSGGGSLLGAGRRRLRRSDAVVAVSPSWRCGVAGTGAGIPRPLCWQA